MKEHPISKYLVGLDGTIINPKTGYKLNPTLSPAGYLKIGTYICSSGMVHQAIYETYINLVPKGMYINHKDGNKLNNSLDNLEVVTPKENTIHAYKLGLAKGCKGETNSMAKLTESEVLKIYSLFKENLCNSCISRKFNVHDRYISLIRIGKRWKYLFKETFPKSNKWKCSCSIATTIETTEK